MRLAGLALLLAGCVDTILPGGVSVTEPGFPGEGDGLCLTADLTSVVFDGTVAVEERAPTVVTLAIPDGCLEPFALVQSTTLDDPAGAFGIRALDEPVELEPGDTLPIELSLLATEPGTYEGQLVVSGVGAFAEGSITVQLFAEIP